jgi:hypothetical protein
VAVEQSVRQDLRVPLGVLALLLGVPEVAE